MKKLLFIGALLIAGATSFGAVSAEFSENDGSGNITAGSAAASLRLASRGTVIDTTNKAVLVVTPTVNAGADGESLSFDFASVIKGQAQTLEGKFTAEIWANDKKAPFGTAEVGTALSLADGISEGPSVSDEAITNISLKDTSTGSDIGTLAYTLSGTQTNNYTYTGTVNSTIKATNTGSFNDKSAVVTVSVSNFTYTKTF